jgi:integrase
LKAMILLAANCALGQTDCANVPQSALDLDNGWLDFPRPKTGIDRHCPLWPETVEAVREAISRRPNPKGEADADLVFVTKYGNRWVRSSNHADPGQRVAIDAVAHEFSILLKRLSINGKRNFYALRHGFQTVAGEAKDPDATSAIMGHAQNDMASVYRERISDERLRAVVDSVHRWLFGE